MSKLRRLNLKKYPVTYDGAKFMVTIKDKPTWIFTEYSSFPRLEKRTHVNVYKVDIINVLGLSLKKYKKLYHKYYRDPFGWENIRKDDDMYINLARRMVKRSYNAYKEDIERTKDELFRRAKFELWEGEIE